MNTQHHITMVGAPYLWQDELVAALTGAGWEVVRVRQLRQVPAGTELVIFDDLDQDFAAGLVADSLVGFGPKVPRLVVVADLARAAATEALAAGATDVTARYAAVATVIAKVRLLLRVGMSDTGLDAGVLSSALFKVNELLTGRGDETAALVAALLVIAETFRFDRASLVAHIEGSDNVFVIAANDAPSRARFVVSIQNYPEIAHAIRSGQPVLIDDVLTDPMMQSVRQSLQGRNVRGAVVVPVIARGIPLGVLMLRGPQAGVGHMRGRALELAQLLASVMGAHMRHGAVLESLREQTTSISRVRYEAERRLRGIHSLQEHFESGSDGVVVLDRDGRILFVNRAAERITGVARDGLLGTELIDLIPTDERPLIQEAIAQVLAGNNLDPFDVALGAQVGEPLWVSVSTSTVLSESGAVILMFRDVSAERTLARELGATKEFLERLIDSAVDAIIAADMQGYILIFNQGAERLFGYRAEDVIGQLHVSQLYDEGVDKQIMRMLRSTAYGGVGRLEQTRRQIRTAVGEIVPVSMTASIVYDGENEVASVGVLTDLRERIRMEQRLLDAQQKLQATERQALVAELAGAAAHELNQPLTSIMGYAQLVQRQSAPDAAHLRGVGIILSEAERMADIVRKIGRITKYETTEYIGGQRIVDLSKSSTTDEQTGEFKPVRPASVPGEE